MIQISNFKKLPTNSGIYLLVISGKKYIGSSQCIRQRVQTHRKELKTGRHQNNYLQNLFNKHGEINMYVEVLYTFEEVPLYEELLQKEKYYIDELDPEINFIKDPTTGNNCKSTSKRVYQYDIIGTFLREFESISEVKRSTGISCGFVCRKAKHCKSAGGYLWSYQKYDVYPIRYDNKSAEAKTKKVKCSNGKEYNSIASAARDLFSGNFDSICASISSCCRGKSKKYKGFSFHYLSGEDT